VTATTTGPGCGAPFNRYRVVNGCLCRARRDLEGVEIVERLASFDARIDEELVYDDGAEMATIFVVSGRTHDGRELRRLRVAASEFNGMGWMMTGWGSAAVVEAGAKDHLRAAILTLSSPCRRHIFRRTGWTEIGGAWAFLYQGGAVGADGVEVELEPPLDRFRLPANAEDVRDAIRTSLSLLDCGPPTVTVPLLGAVYLAPVSFILNPDAAVWCFGASGSLKSELASLAQAHYGDFDRKNLPANWSSTTASTEERLFSLADVLVTLDDFAPQGNRRAEGELHQRAERILRSIGNQSARGRVRGDLVARPDRPPRGLVLSTGESLPAGHSVNARLVAVEVDRYRLDLDAVTRLQHRRHRLPHAMRAFVDWLRLRIPELREALPARREELRTVFRRADGHLRQGDALAHVYIGIELFARFARDSEALTADERDGLLVKARDALLATSDDQSACLARADPAERFVEVLSILLARRRVYMEPAAPNGAAMVGFRVGNSALLLPEATYGEVAAHLRANGEHWAPAAPQLHASLVQKGYVLPDAEGRAISQHRVGARRRPRVLNIPMYFLTGEGSGSGSTRIDGPGGVGDLSQPTQPTLGQNAGEVGITETYPATVLGVS
jgi:hypothetical protein